MERNNSGKMLIVTAIGFVIILILAVAWQCKAAEPMGRSDAILDLVTPRTSYRGRLPYNGKYLKAYKDAVYRSKLVVAFENAAEKFEVPTNLLIAMTYRETVFRTGLLGPAGEQGILQVGKDARRGCRRYCKDLDTVEGGVFCGACWLARGRDWCQGDIIKGINAYVSGRCNPRTISAQRATQNRVWIWGYLNELTGGARVPTPRFKQIGVSAAKVTNKTRKGIVD